MRLGYENGFHRSEETRSPTLSENEQAGVKSCDTFRERNYFKIRQEIKHKQQDYSFFVQLSIPQLLTSTKITWLLKQLRKKGQ